MTDETKRAIAEAERVKGYNSKLGRFARSLLALAAERQADTVRLEFAFSVANCADSFCHFVNEYHPTKQTSQRRATDEEWRAAIDAAIAKRKQ